MSKNNLAYNITQHELVFQWKTIHFWSDQVQNIFCEFQKKFGSAKQYSFFKKQPILTLWWFVNLGLFKWPRCKAEFGSCSPTSIPLKWINFNIRLKNFCFTLQSVQYPSIWLFFEVEKMPLFPFRIWICINKLIIGNNVFLRDENRQTHQQWHL